MFQTFALSFFIHLDESFCQIKLLRFLPFTFNQRCFLMFWCNFYRIILIEIRLEVKQTWFSWIFDKISCFWRCYNIFIQFLSCMACLSPIIFEKCLNNKQRLKNNVSRNKTQAWMHYCAWKLIVSCPHFIFLLTNII